MKIKLGTFLSSILVLILKLLEKKNSFLTKSLQLFLRDKKVLPASESSVSQLLDAMGFNKQGILNSYKFTAKTHLTMEKKIFISLYPEHLRFLIVRCGWMVTKIYIHFTFEQDTFKKICNTKPGGSQNAKSDMEKNFYNLMNNSNFGCNCS